MSQKQATYKIGATEQEDSLNNARAMMGWDRPIEIEDDSDLKKYRIELPNLYDDAELDPYEFRLLAHYKRVGTCTEGTRTTGIKCKMSNSQVSQKRRALHRKGFIVMKKVSISAKEYSYKITIVDKWRENFDKYSPVHVVNTPRLPHETKKVEEGEGKTQNVFTVYEHEIGPLTPHLANELEEAETVHGANWVAEALKIASTNGKRNWAYVKAILTRWKADGYGTDKNKKAPAFAQAHVNDLSDIDRILA